MSDDIIDTIAEVLSPEVGVRADRLAEEIFAALTDSECGPLIRESRIAGRDGLFPTGSECVRWVTRLAAQAAEADQ